MAVMSRKAKIISGSQISFLSRDEEAYPQLTRLYLDYDFQVLAIASARVDMAAQYLITYRNPQDSLTTVVSPAFDSLPDLEEYTNDNIIEILHETLFAASEDDEALSR